MRNDQLFYLKIRKQKKSSFFQLQPHQFELIASENSTNFLIDSISNSSHTFYTAFFRSLTMRETFPSSEKIP